MTDDLVGRLRAYRPPNEWGDGVNHVICEEAAARIEALEAALEEIADMETQQLAACAARAALEAPHAD